MSSNVAAKRPAGGVEGLLVPVPAGATVSLAAFRSGETARLSRQLGFPVSVIAVAGDPGRHARWLSGRWHGALRPREEWFLPFDSWDATPETVVYDQFAFDRRWMGGRPLPWGMSLSDGCLRFRLPPGVGRAAFLRRFKVAMEDRAFERVAARPAEVRFRFRTGRPLEVGPRYGAHPARWRHPEMCDDLYAFGPRDLRRLVGRAAGVLADLAVRAILAAHATQPAD